MAKMMHDLITAQCLPTLKADNSLKEPYLIQNKPTNFHAIPAPFQSPPADVPENAGDMPGQIQEPKS
jgi:hypothetical protein